MSETNSWLEQFHQMVAELKEHPRVAITNLWVGKPATEEEIESIEEALGFKLDEALKDLYRQADGVQLRWMDRESEDFDNNNYEGIVTERYSPLRGDWEQATGIIDIIPMRESLLDEEDEYGFYDSDEFDEPLHPFDLFSPDNSAAILLNEETPGTTIRIGEGNDSTFEDSDEVDLNEYLEFIIRHRGMPNPRRGAYFTENSYYKEFQDLVIPAGQPRPSIDTVLPESSDDWS